MICRNCGNPLSGEQSFCPRCGASTAAGIANDHMPAQPSRSARKTSTVVITMALVFLSVAVVVGTAAFILTRVWSRTMSTEDVYEEYREILSAAKDDIDRYTEENDMAPVALYDINNSGVDDLIYADEDTDSGDGSPRLNFAVDQKGKIRRYTPDSSRDFILFTRKSDGALFEYTVTGDGEAYHRLSSENGSRLESYSRKYHEDTDEYEYSYSTNSGEKPADSAGTLYEKLVSDLQDDEITVIMTDCTEDEVNEIFPKKPEIISTGYDEAVQQIEVVIEEVKSDDTATPDETAAPTERKAEKISVSDIPEQESLKRFLQLFSFGYRTGKIGKDAQKYDYEDPDSSMVLYIAGNPTCVDLSLYPGEEPVWDWNPMKDPLGKYGDMGGHLSVEKDKILWTLENIFHIPEDKAAAFIKEEVDNEDNRLYEYEEDGKTYLCNILLGVGGPGYEIDFTDAKYDGEKYYLIFDRYIYGTSKDEAMELASYYVEMSLEKIDGKQYWTLYRHSADIPDWTEEETERKDKGTPATDAQTSSFSAFAGDYTFASGAGGWASNMTLNSDGTFTGMYSDSNMALGSNEYKMELYYSEFNGQFVNFQKVNEYTYSFELASIDYVYEPGTEEITDAHTNGTKALTKYSTAYGLDNGTKTVYAYTAEAPWENLPEDFRAWIHMIRGNDNPGELGRKCLYMTEPKYGWFGNLE